MHYYFKLIISAFGMLSFILLTQSATLTTNVVYVLDFVMVSILTFSSYFRAPLALHHSHISHCNVMNQTSIHRPVPNNYVDQLGDLLICSLFLTRKRSPLL
jgi:hypothetical protein